MTPDVGLLLLLFAGMVYLFLTEKIPIDLTAFCGLVFLIFTGYVTPSEAFSGFASSAVITILSICIISGALLQTGIADLLGDRIHHWVGSKELPLMVTIMGLTGVLSAFMPNLAATAVMMPAVAAIGRKAKLSPSRLFIPLSFGAILGGTTTLVGTAPNILTAEMLTSRGLQPFGVFEFTPLGFVLLSCGILYMITIGRRLLPKREHGPTLSATAQLADVYQLEERLFSLQIPHDSPLHGSTIGESSLGATLGVKVVAISRDGEQIVAPSPDEMLCGKDVLILEGQLSDLKELLRVREVEVEKTGTGALPRPTRGVSGLRARLKEGSAFEGESLTGLRFRERFGIVVVAIKRGAMILRDQIGLEALQAGDEIIALGIREQLRKFRESTEEFEVSQLGLSAMQPLQEQLFVIRVPDDSPLAGETVRSSRIGELAGVTVGGIIRESETRLAVPTDEVIRGGDRLLVAGEPSRIVGLLKLGEVDLDSSVVAPVLESEEAGLVEAAIAPRSRLVGKTVKELKFRDRYGLQVLAVWREGRPIHSDLAHLPLRFGDALLLQGPYDKIRNLSGDMDLVVLSEVVETPRRKEKAPYALGGLLLMIVLVVSGYEPIHVAAFTGATVVVLLGALRMEEAYRVIEWRAIFLVAAVLPVGIAMERTGAAGLLATTVGEVAGPIGPYAVLAALVCLSSLLSQGLDGAPAVVLLTPVALQAAGDLSISPYPIMMGVGLAASAAFMTPFSHKANLLVMGAGGYRSLDYVKVGTPLTIALLALLVVLVPVFFPF